MKCKIPEISWHNRDPVLSVDIQALCTKNTGVDNSIYRLASGGTDAHVLIWYLHLASDGSEIDLDLAADLARHQRAVNAVRWSPNGEFLASGDDESVIFIWKQKTDSEPPNILDNTNEQDKEVWITLKVLRGHMEDVYDLSWSPNSQFLVSGSVDNTAIIWDIAKGKSMSILREHKGFVQGVAWDPKNQYIATLSTDRYLRIFDIQTRRVVHRVNKSTLSVPEGHELHGKSLRLFHDDTLQTFFRRLSFTPDGKLLITPAGVTDYDGVTHPLNTTYAFSRYTFRQPSIVMPCPDQYTVAVRCCPQIFRLRPHNAAKNPPVVPLPYRMIFAVATRSSVYFYDTQQRPPFAVISNIHYTRLTDATWSSDGRIVVVSSTDGFCSLITFENGELGELYEDADAVLDAAEAKDMSGVAGKKSKKQKENEQKLRKSDDATENKPNKSIVGEPLTEKNIDAQVTTNDNQNCCENNINVKADMPSTQVIVEVVKSLPVDIILDREILSSDERFESPEKKGRAVTPITVRRHPRTPISSCTQAPGSATITAKQSATTPKNSSEGEISTPRQKKATPIAIRRKPRAIIPPAPSAGSAIVAEEAMDAWPVELSTKPADSDTIKLPSSSSSSSPAKDAQPVPSATTTIPTKKSFLNTDVSLGCTQDIRLVYEDTVEAIETKTEAKEVAEEPVANTTATVDDVGKAVQSTSNTCVTQKQRQATPNNKTPRRVELKTISTPKSKKKLL